MPDPHATAYQLFPGWPLVDVTVFDPSQAGAAGAMISTTGVLNQFLRALMGGRLLAWRNWPRCRGPSRPGSPVSATASGSCTAS